MTWKTSNSNNRAALIWDSCLLITLKKATAHSRVVFVCTYITWKKHELESLCYLGLVALLICLKICVLSRFFHFQLFRSFVCIVVMKAHNFWILEWISFFFIFFDFLRFLTNAGKTSFSIFAWGNLPKLCHFMNFMGLMLTLTLKTV